MLAVTYIYVSDFFSLSRIETRQVLEPHLSCLKILSFQIKISPKAKKKPTTLLPLLGSLKRYTVEVFFHMFY